ncbi:MAG TPA: hypothetical protein VFX61_11905 [Micromonosporaceae bacterium]|nr:hypothetical protein [Micromonosporaceae bacterium]
MSQIRQEWGAETPSREDPRPVFVDRSGRRRRMAVFAGIGIGAGLLVSLALIVAGLFTGSSVPLPGWPDGIGQHQQDGPKLEPVPVPTTSAPASPTRTDSPSQPGDPTSTTTATPRPTAPAPATTERPGQGDEHRATQPPGKPSKSPGKPE